MIKTAVPIATILLSVSVLKAPLGIKLYLNIIPILIGLFFWVKNRLSIRHLNLFLPTIIMLGIGTVVSFQIGQITSVARLGQVGCLLGFAAFMAQEFPESEFERVCKYILYISLGVFSLEYIWLGPIGELKNFFGIFIPQLSGPVGEPNYSASIIVFAGIYLWQRRYFRHFVLAFALVVASASRMGFLTLLAFLLISGIKIFLKDKNFSFFLKTLITLFFLSPILIFLINLFASYELKVFLEKISSGRFFLFVPYIDMGMDHLFGVGYFNGKNMYPDYLAPIKTMVDQIRGHQINQQHSYFIQVFSEFGIVGYFLLMWQFSIFITLKEKSNRYLSFLTLMASTLFMYLFLNGMNDFILYAAIGFLVKQTNGESFLMFSPFKSAPNLNKVI